MPELLRPRIAVLATGGTIAGSPAAGLGYQAGLLTIAQIVAALPDLSGRVDLSVEQVANIGSQSVDYAFWHTLSRRIQIVSDSGDVDGVVVTHGTDTMEETAYLLNLVLTTRAPVVLTGALRPSQFPGADGAANLSDAIAVAAHPAAYGRGVMVVMNEEIHGARDVQKMAASGLAAFASPNRGPLGRVQGHNVTFYSNPAVDGTLTSGLAPLGPDRAPRVLVMYSHGDLSGALIDAMIALEPDGIVVAGVGNGNTSDTAIQALAQAAARGTVVVRASRTGTGRVERNIEVDDERHGFVAAYDLNPQKARVLLMLALRHTRNAAAIQNWFMRPF